MKNEKNLNLITKILIGFLIVLALLVLGVGVYKYMENNNSDNFKDENEQNFEEIKKNEYERQELKFNNSTGEKKKEFEIENIKLYDFGLLNLGGSIQINGKIENNSDKAIENFRLLFELLDIAGNVQHKYQMEIPEKIEPNEIRNVETVIGFDNDKISALNVEVLLSENN